MSVHVFHVIFYGSHKKTRNIYTHIVYGNSLKHEWTLKHDRKLSDVINSGRQKKKGNFFLCVFCASKLNCPPGWSGQTYVNILFGLFSNSIQYSVYKTIWGINYFLKSPNLGCS